MCGEVRRGSEAEIKGKGTYEDMFVIEKARVQK